MSRLKTAETRILGVEPIVPRGGLPRVTDGDGEKLKLRHELGLTRKAFAELMGIGERTLAEVERGGREAEKLRRPYREAEAVYEALCRLVEPDEAARWFVTENDRFGGFKPLELIARGEIGKLWRMIYALERGTPG